MKPTLFALLLASSLAFGQKFQDVTAKDSPLSLSIRLCPGDSERCVFAHNNSSKGVLALDAIVKLTDAKGELVTLYARQDYAFKFGPLEFREERPIALAEGTEPDEKVAQAVGAVLWVQFEDGSIWGDPESGKTLRGTRPQRLSFLKRLVETYYESGEDAFNAILNDANLPRAERSVAGCLKADSEYLKLAPIDLAKKELGDAQGWNASGLF
jgi:hypothetical protein